jgi:hypothetical protein
MNSDDLARGVMFVGTLRSRLQDCVTLPGL